MSAVVVNESSQVRAAKHLASATAPGDGETVIVDPVSGRYYGLNDYAVRVWALIQQPRRVADVRDAILEEYEVGPDELLEDITALIQELAEAGLVEIASGT